MEAKIIVSEDNFETYSTDETHPLFKSLQHSTKAGKPGVLEGDKMVIHVSNFKKFRYAAVQLIASEGGEVEKFPAWVVLTDADFQNNDVPAYLPGATVIDAEENEATRKWSEWPDANHPARQTTDGDWYVATNSRGNHDLLGSVLKQLTDDGFTIADTPQYKEAFAEPDPE